MFENIIGNLEAGAIIKVIGVGGAGNNAVNRMVSDGVQGVEFYVANTDAQVLSTSKATNKVLLGREATRGLGAGSNPEVGRLAALESEEEIKKAVYGADMVFIACGLGGGTGTGAAPIIAKIARDQGALVVGIVTKPFTFEGRQRNAHAHVGLDDMKKYTDSIIVISNDRLLEVIGGVPLKEAFLEADNVLRQGVQTITDLISIPSLINLDFADVRNVMGNKGTALIGIGMASGDKRAEEAALKAIRTPLLEANIKGAKNAIVNVTGGKEFTLLDANDAVDIIKQAAGGDVNIVFGVAINENLTDEMIVTVIATGFPEGGTGFDDEANIIRRHRSTTVPDAPPDGEYNGARPEFVQREISHVEFDDEDSTREYDNTEEMDDLPSFLKRKVGELDE